jgi:hypothetical protein
LTIAVHMVSLTGLSRYQLASFRPYFQSIIDQVVLEKKLEIWKVFRRRTTDAKWWQRSRWTKNNENTSWFIAIKHMLWKYDLKEASSPAEWQLILNWGWIIPVFRFSTVMKLSPLYNGSSCITTI